VEPNQLGFTITYHYLFSELTMGLALNLGVICDGWPDGFKPRDVGTGLAKRAMCAARGIEAPSPPATGLQPVPGAD
jgi:hypothetical protein